MYILGGSSAKSVTTNLAKMMKQPIAKTVHKRFPDDEFYVRILDNLKGKDVVIVQTTYPDEKIIELLLLQDAVYEAGAEHVTVAIPYFGYSRQDKKFLNGEPISARAIAEHINLRADKIIMVDPHKEHIIKFFKTPGKSCSAIPEIAQYLKHKHIDFILAPDKGAKERAKEAASILCCEYDYLEKTRIDGATVKIQPKNLDIQGKKIAIVDDIISTGGTMATSVKELKKQGANQVLVACTHGLFIRGAKKKLLSAGCDEIIATDTIENEFSKVTVAPCIAKEVES